MPEATGVSAILVTYRRPEELDGALVNFINQDIEPDEIIVLDNDPHGSARQAPHIDHPLVRYLCPGANLGTAGGRNRAAAEARGEFLLFLDDDARFERYNVIAEMHRLFREQDIGCLSFLLRHGNTMEVTTRDYPGSHPERWMDAHDVSRFLGTAFAIRRALFLDLGGFDQVLFHGSEELDLSYRLLNACWRIHYTPSVVAFHRMAKEGRDDLRPGFRLIRNRLYMAMKYMPFPLLLTQVTAWSVISLYHALRNRELREYLNGWQSLKADGLWAKAREFRRTHRLGWETLRYLRKHEGRLLY